MIQHPVFLRCVGDKTIITTIIPTEELGIPIKDDMFIIATTGSSIYTNNNPSITLDSRTLIRPEAYLKTIKQEDEDIKGNSIGGILRLPIWFVRKVKSIMEQMGC